LVHEVDWISSEAARADRLFSNTCSEMFRRRIFNDECFYIEISLDSTIGDMHGNAINLHIDAVITLFSRSILAHPSKILCTNYA